MEQDMVTNLARTLALKNDAVKNLRDKNKILQKTLEPRKAYKYMPKEMTPIDAMVASRAHTLQQFNKLSQAAGSLPNSPSQRSLAL